MLILTTLTLLKDFEYLTSINNRNGRYKQEIRRKLGVRRAAMKELEKTINQDNLYYSSLL